MLGVFITDRLTKLRFNRDLIEKFNIIFLHFKIMHCITLHCKVIII